ncbi:hypothetical protein H5J25_15625 [Sphingomonas aliaeris]|uniref:Uncharacterized protein n=1 Tax=Sphingomonas aliaeris TaxID=2759526 RepID=A0A974NTT3_9SPHN|nr:hypothetical protein [Sphingomonas aliaeris]QQV76816.1 hypothetical protein H5J25_15625 [Sphingomonas aliaeris]
MQGMTRSAVIDDASVADTACRDGAAATVVSWQEIGRSKGPSERRRVVCMSRVVAQPAERDDTEAGQ